MLRLPPAAGLAGVLALLAPAARAEPFTLLIYETEADLALRADTGPAGQAYWMGYQRFAETLGAAGAMRGGSPLALPAEAVSIGRDGASRSSASQGGLYLSGYLIIEAADLAAAEALAAKAPGLARGGRIEVRAAYPAPAGHMAH